MVFKNYKHKICIYINGIVVILKNSRMLKIHMQASIDKMKSCLIFVLENFKIGTNTHKWEIKQY